MKDKGPNNDGLQVKPGDLLNQPIEDNIVDAGRFFLTMADQSLLKPMEIRGREVEALERDSERRDIFINGHKNESSRLQNWQNIKPFKTSRTIGEAVAGRIELPKDNKDSKLSALETDANVVRYLVDEKISAFLAGSNLGESTDEKNSLRRVRILSTLKSIEEKYIETHGIVVDEKGWQEFYGKLYDFFDPKTAPGSVSENVDWLRTYILYYSAVWNYTDIGPFADGEPEIENKNKFKGLLGFISTLSKENQERLLSKMSKLDKSTDMKLPELSARPTFEFRRSLDNLQFSNFLNRDKTQAS